MESEEDDEFHVSDCFEDEEEEEFKVEDVIANKQAMFTPENVIYEKKESISTNKQSSSDSNGSEEEAQEVQLVAASQLE